MSLEFGARAGAHALVSACASGAEAIGYGVDMIRSGRADVVIAGGTEATIHPMPVAAFAASRTLSLRNDDPEGASRPYDVDRDGFVIGEGAGIVILESAEHAAARGARVYARIAGVGLSADGYHITSPEPSGEGQIRAMQAALDESGIAGPTSCTSTRTPRRRSWVTSSRLARSAACWATRPTTSCSPPPSR